MRYYTHLAFSFLVGIILIRYLSISNQILFMIIFLFFSIFPDIDSTKSKISKKIKPIAWLIKISLGHRGLIHSIFPPIILYFLLLPINKPAAIAASIGYLTHLLLDCLNKRGLSILWPLKKKIKGPIKTGSLTENILFAIFLIIDIYLLINF